MNNGKKFLEENYKKTYLNMQLQNRLKIDKIGYDLKDKVEQLVNLKKKELVEEMH